jgi:hypothetical protein
MSRRGWVALLVFITVLAAMSVLRLSAQTTFGVIRGTVLDSAGASMVGVSVTARHEGTNISRQVLTDQRGNYEITHLNPGPYTIIAEITGFQRHVHQHLSLETAQTLRVDVAMQIGQITETVTVSGEAPLIETDSGTISDVRTGRQITELPINVVRGDAFGGGIFSAMSLSPGSFRYQGASRHSFGGSRGTQASFLMDGTTLGDQRGGQITPMQPSFETVQEMKLIMVNTSAEYPNLANVVVTSKSGSNQLHGSLFHQYNSGSLNARNFFQPNVPWRVYNQFGASVSGPILRDRTFFLVSYEGNRDHSQANYNVNVPSVAMRQGDFSQALDRQGRVISIRDPLTGQPFPNNVIPPNRTSPVTRGAQDMFYPLPNFGGPELLVGNHRTQRTQAPYWDHIDGRMDHQLTSKNSFYGRYTWRDMPTHTADGPLPTAGYMYRLRKIRNLTLADTHVFSPGVVNEFRFGHTWHELPRWGQFQGLEVARTLGIQGLTTTADINAVPEFNIVDFTSISQIEYNTPAHRTYDFVNNVSVMTGRHALKFGVNHRRNRDLSNPIPNSIYGRYDFNGTFSGFSYADFLLGIPQQTFRDTPRTPTDGTNQSWAFFVQDDFKFHRNLTLNFGLRYDRMNPFHEESDSIYNFDVTTGNLVVPSSRTLQEHISPLFPATINIVTADQTGFPQRGLRRNDNNNFAPRVGLAWRPLGNSRTVIRSSFGVFQNPLTGATFGPLVSGGPFVSAEQFVNRLVNGVPLFQFPRPFLETGQFGGTINVQGMNPGLRHPYTMQWNLTVEQEIGAMAVRTSYIGTRSVNLLYRRNFNQPLPSTIPFNNNRRLYPQYRNVVYAENGGNSFYNALQIEAERKFAKGLYYQLGYTWAKQLSNGEDAGELGYQIENAYDRAREWGDDLWLMRHRLVGNFMWEIPFGLGRPWLSGGRGLRGFASHALGGWNLSGMSVIQSGQRMTATFSGRDIANTDTLSGRADRLRDGNLPRSERSLERWFDVDAFAIPPVNAGRFGTAGNGILEGPGMVNFSFGLAKTFRFRERGRLEFRLDSTNTFNHPNFGNPATNITSVTTRGQITSLQGQDESGARVVMFGTRIEF